MHFVNTLHGSAHWNHPCEPLKPDGSLSFRTMFIRGVFPELNIPQMCMSKSFSLAIGVRANPKMNAKTKHSPELSIPKHQAMNRTPTMRTSRHLYTHLDSSSLPCPTSRVQRSRQSLSTPTTHPSKIPPSPRQTNLNSSLNGQNFANAI
jgi:hypothetical protein